MVSLRPAQLLPLVLRVGGARSRARSARQRVDETRWEDGEGTSLRWTCKERLSVKKGAQRNEEKDEKRRSEEKEMVIFVMYRRSCHGERIQVEHDDERRSEGPHLKTDITGYARGYKGQQHSGWTSV